MAITTTGFAGPIDEVQAALMLPTGASYYVENSSSWVPSISPTLDRTVTVSAGVGRARVLRTTITTPTNVQFPVQASGSRWDLLVMRHTYSPPGGASALAIIPGTAAINSTWAQRNVLRGPDDRVDDHPIALVQITAGSQAPTAIIDLRTSYANGALLARSFEALNYLEDLGTQVVIDSVLWTRALDGSGVPVWRQTPLQPPRQNWYQYVSTAPSNSILSVLGQARPVPASGVVVAWNSGTTVLPAGHWSITVEAIVKRTDAGTTAVAATDVVRVNGGRVLYNQQHDIGAPGAVGFSRRMVAGLLHWLPSPSAVSGDFAISTAGVGLEYKFARVTYQYVGQDQMGGENV